MIIQSMNVADECYCAPEDPSLGNTHVYIFYSSHRMMIIFPSQIPCVVILICITGFRQKWAHMGHLSYIYMDIKEIYRQGLSKCLRQTALAGGTALEFLLLITNGASTLVFQHIGFKAIDPNKDSLAVCVNNLYRDLCRVLPHSNCEFGSRVLFSWIFQPGTLSALRD